MIIAKIEDFLKRIDSYRDKMLFLIIKPYWPLIITPNHISYIRLFVGIILFFLLFVVGYNEKYLILSLFLIGALSDFIDGPVARGTNRVTEFGAVLDSTADRFLILPIAIYSLFQDYKLLLIFLLFGEISNAISAFYFKSKEIYLESDMFGKIKMVLFCIAFVAMLVYFPLSPPPFFIGMLWLTLPLTFLSIINRIIYLTNSYGPRNI